MSSTQRATSFIMAWFVGSLAWSCVNAQEVSLSKASNTCFGTWKGLPRWTEPPIPGCVVSWSVVGMAQGVTLFEGRYSRPSPEGTDARIVTEVLFKATEQPGQVVPLHAVEEDETYNFLRPYSLYIVANRSLLELNICLNGTGGCGQEFIEFHNGAIRPVIGEIRGQIEALLPPGLTQNKNPHVSLSQLRGQGGAWAKNDPNCCPSYDVAFNVRLVGNRLRVKDIVVTRAPER
jgi:hypothetical protein